MLGSIVQGQLGVAARVAALRRGARSAAPPVPTIIAAECPILTIEATLAALTSFTLVGPLGLPWWLPLILVAVVGSASAGFRHLALRKGRAVWNGLAVLRSSSGGTRLIGFVLIAVFAQIFRNWMLLHAVGVDASFFDAIAVLIAVVTLGQLPIGPSVGRGRGRADSRWRRRRRGGGRGRAADGHRHRRRALLRGLGRRRLALGRSAPAPRRGPADARAGRGRRRLRQRSRTT